MNTKLKSNDAAETPEAEALSAEVAALRAEFKTLLGKVEAVGAAAAEGAKATVRAKAAKGIETGEAIAADLLGDWRSLDRKVVDAARDQPWRTLGAAALIGFMLGLILRR